MKKYVLGIGTAILLCLCLVISVSASEAPADAPATLLGNYGDLTWEVSNSTLTISGTGAMPDQTSVVDAPWYSHINEIDTVIIEEGVSSIGDYTFIHCTKLKSISIPDSVTSIGDYAFYACSGLTSISIPDHVTVIESYAFGSTELIDVTIPDSVISIGEGAFVDCFSLKTVTIGSGVADIGIGAFSGCDQLDSVIFEGSAPDIGDDAFSAVSAFCYYPAVDPTWTYEKRGNYGSGILVWEGIYPTSGTCGEHLTWELSDGTLTISGSGAMTNWAFATEVPWHGHSNTIKTIVIGDGVTSIGDFAFELCYNLTAITIPDNVLYIGENAFDQCETLASVTLGSGVTTIGGGAFYYCPKLTSITIPASVTSIGDYAFSECGITSVTFEGSAPAIGKDAFSSVTATCYYSGTDSSWTNDVLQQYGGTLKWVSGTCGEHLTWELSDGTLTISGSGAMTNWASATEVPWYGDNYTIQTIVIGDGVTSIGDCAFQDCYALTSVTIPNSVTSIGECAFYYCNALTSVTIPNSVTSIGECAFYCCEALAGITIPDRVDYIGDYAFQECYALTSVTISPNVIFIGTQAFYGCTSLESISVAESNLRYSSADGVLFNKDKTLLMTYPAGKTDTTYTIPNSVTTLEPYAFAACTNLTTVTIPGSITSISDYSFYCAGLTSITIPGTITSIGKEAFYSCSKLENITFTGSAPVIKADAFFDVTATCSYPASNPTWTSNKRQDYGRGTLTWSGTGSSDYEAAVLNNGYYEISNVSQLYWFANFVNAGNTAANGRLTADIVVNNGNVINSGTSIENTSYLQWMPIAAYSGTFDGNGHTISGLYYFCKDSTQAQTKGNFGGLFYDVSGTITDLTIENSFFYHYSSSGTTAGLCHSNSGTIENCVVTVFVGSAGLVYKNLADGKIEDCEFRGKQAYNGICSENYGTISHCSNYGTPTRTGICGTNQGTLSDCENRAKINASISHASGICGENNGIILRCANLADIYSTTTYVGGICGENRGGKLGGGIIKACYNTGAIHSEKTRSGGIVGSNVGLVIGCYNTGSTYATADSGSICGYNDYHSSQAYDQPGTVIYCISYSGTNVIGTAKTNSIARNNYMAYELGNLSPAYLLNGLTSVGNVDWYQNIDNGKPVDSYPVLDSSHGKVYHAGSFNYTNTPQTEVKAGQCGNLQWALDETGTLTITGMGTMPDYAPGEAPWYPWREEIRSVVFSGRISSVGTYAFYNCTALQRVELGNYVSSIGGRAFALCTALDAIYYGVYSSGASIGALAFYGCTALKTISVPAPLSVASYGFEGCTKLNSIYINTFNEASITVSENAFVDVNATVYYPQGMTQPAIDSTHGGTLQFQRTIAGTCGVDVRWAFDAGSGTLTLSGAGLPQEYMEGRDAPWAGLRNSIAHVIVEEGITGIPNHTFEFLEMAETISLPVGLNTLSYTAFNDCARLNHLLIPAGVVTMGNNYGFVRCDALTDVYYLGTAENWAQVEYSQYLNQNIRLHCLTLQDDNPPTCTTSGTAPYYAFDDKTVYAGKYNENGDVITQLETLPSTGHSPMPMEGNAPSCTEPGWSAGEYCPDCKTWLIPQEAVPAPGHSNYYLTIGNELYCACRNCEEMNLTCSIAWNGQTVSVMFATVSPVYRICGVLYDTDGRMLELYTAVAETTETTLSFRNSATADSLQVLFVDQNWNPCLPSMHIKTPG